MTLRGILAALFLEVWTLGVSNDLLLPGERRNKQIPSPHSYYWAGREDGDKGSFAHIVSVTSKYLNLSE